MFFINSVLSYCASLMLHLNSLYIIVSLFKRERLQYTIFVSESKMNDPLITIAIPAYNNEKTIQKTIDSCLSQQTNIKYEVLIVDDASEDNTLKIISQYDDERIRIVTLDNRVPIMENHNNCFKNARGEYVLFCHADDLLEEHAIETIANKLKQRNYPKKYILWGHSMFRDPYVILKKAGFSINEMIVGEYAPMLFLYGAVTPTGTCYSSKSIKKLGGFLQANHRLAPSDITSHIYFAIHGFRFEMMDEMIFIRKYASTATETDEAIILDSLDDAFQQLLEVTNEEDINMLLKMSTKRQFKPYRIYYALAQNSKFKKCIKSIVFRELLTYPLLIKSKLVRKLLKRLFSK